MYSIVLILPYFGKLSPFNDYWIKSVEKNNTVNFLMITDQNVKYIPNNMRVVKMTFNSFVLKLSKMLDCDFSFIYPYKLCDLKPAYGYLLYDYIKEFDFWGHCDNDLIFGDIRRFITNDVLRNNDRILTRGHFTLYRNTPEVNLVFKKAEPSYKKVFSHTDIFHFDEHPVTGKYWFENLRDKVYDKIIFDDLDWHKFNFVDVHKHYTLDKGRDYFIYSFENGKLFRVFCENGKIGKEEIMYAHFQKRNIEVLSEPSDNFIIIPNKFVSPSPELNYDYLKKVNRKDCIYPFKVFLYVKWKALKRRAFLFKRKVLQNTTLIRNK